jgi:RNA recognition motif-containing protein
MNLFTRNLPYSVTSEALKEAFSQHGLVDRAQVIIDHETGRSRGFGFVEMPNTSEAEEALRALDGADWGGRQIVVQPAKPRAPGNPQRRPGATDRTASTVPSHGDIYD